MTRNELKEHLWKLRCLLDELEDADGRVSKALGLLAKGVEVYDYLQEMHLTDALDMYRRLDEPRQAHFIGLISKGEEA